MKKYYLLKKGQQVGPFSIDELKSKNIKKTNLVWAEGMADWLKASEVAELNTLFVVMPPPPPSKAAAPPPPPPSQQQVPPPPQQPEVTQYQAPPPPQTPQYQTPPVQQNYPSSQAQQNGYVPKSGRGWVIAGYIFSIMGGFVGIAIGGYLKGAKEKLPDGVKVKKFDAKAQKNGLIIIIISAISWAFWMQMNK